MIGMPMVVADLPVLREVLRADGSEPVTFVAPHDVENWIGGNRRGARRTTGARASRRHSRAPCAAIFAAADDRNYLTLFDAQPKAESGAFAGLQAAEEARP